jgi:hypothetical protein
MHSAQDAVVRGGDGENGKLQLVGTVPFFPVIVFAASAWNQGCKN